MGKQKGNFDLIFFFASSLAAEGSIRNGLRAGSGAFRISDEKRLAASAGRDGSSFTSPSILLGGPLASMDDWMPLQLPRFNELARNGRSPATTTRNTKTVDDDDDPFPRSRRRLPFSTSSCSKMDGYRFVYPIIIIKKRIRRPKFSTDRSPPRVQHAPSAGNGRGGH